MLPRAGIFLTFLLIPDVARCLIPGRSLITGVRQYMESRKYSSPRSENHYANDTAKAMPRLFFEPTDMIEDEYGQGTPRRVSQLIESMGDRILSRDFSSPLWDAIRYEAAAISEGDLKAATLMSNFILSQPSFQEAVIDFVANQLESPLFQATEIRNVFADVCEQHPQLSSVWGLDLMASAMKDESQPNAVGVLLFDKGFHSLVTYRIANALWYGGRDGLARYFQSLASRTFGADIHPACKIGHGCCLSTATGIVIGETAVVGNDCTILHDVTLGGTGKEHGDRHPKIGNKVYLAAGATILGNIKVGDGAVVNAGSVVTKPVPAYSRVGGVPARLIAQFSEDDDCEGCDIAQMNYDSEVLETLGDGKGSESSSDRGSEPDIPRLYMEFRQRNM